MSKDYLGEPKELLLRVQVPGPHAEKSIRALVTLTGWMAHVVEELESVEQKPRAAIIRDLVEAGIRARAEEVRQSLQAAS